MIARPLPRSGPIPFSLPERPALAPLAERGRPRSQWAKPVAEPDPGSQACGVDQAVQATYCGQGVLSVRSSVTGRLYRFEGRGCTQAIDPRDSLVLARLSDLLVQHTRRGGPRGRNRAST